MTVEYDVINGFCLGIEYVPETEDYEQAIILDLLLIRILIQWT